MKKIKQKIKDRSGESLGETLVALLISALAMVMLVTMNDASGNLISRSIDTVKEYQTGINKLASQNSSESTSKGTASLVSVSETGKNVSLDAASPDDLIPVDFFEAPKSFGAPVISYKKSEE